MTSGSGSITRETVLAALQTIGGAANKAQLARALGAKGEDRALLRGILRELTAEGALASPKKRAFAATDQLPEVAALEVVSVDDDGRVFARAVGVEDLFGPLLEMRHPKGAPKTHAGPALGPGERALARIFRAEDGQWMAEIIRLLAPRSPKILGVFHRGTEGPWIEMADKKAKWDLRVVEDPRGPQAKEGDLVVAREMPRRGYGPGRARIEEVIGRADDPRAASILAIHAHGIMQGFSAEEEQEAASIRPLATKREDLRDLPLLTIDPMDARDHDDAVFARADDDQKNPGGFRLIVAIADVAAFVRPGSALDRGANKRGNSTYFPDRVAPMLPETLSADQCSLREGEDRVCFAVEIILDAQGEKRRHRFFRAIMRSAAKLSYEEAQEAFDGAPGEKAAPLVEPALAPLWAAYQAMAGARERRQPLDLNIPERKVKLVDGKILEIRPRERLEAHRLIEEMMIAANVCAAESAEAKRQALIYRVHDGPGAEKINALADFLGSIGLKWTKGETPTPKRFNALLAQAREEENADIINEMVLRSQAQAEYDPENIGHFGLQLGRYAHFTSPIRRYADLMVHRALIRALDLGDDGLTAEEEARLPAIAEAITITERRSMAAERDATERYIAAFLKDRVGAIFPARITSVTRFGAFVRLKEIGADGLVPVSLLGQERFRFEEGSFALTGERSRTRFMLGQTVEVRLLEAAPVTGGLICAMLSKPLAPVTRPERRAVENEARFDPEDRRPMGRKPGAAGGKGKKRR